MIVGGFEGVGFFVLVSYFFCVGEGRGGDRGRIRDSGCFQVTGASRVLGEV